jgi:hypothetical protein
MPPIMQRLFTVRVAGSALAILLVAGLAGPVGLAGQAGQAPSTGSGQVRTYRTRLSPVPIDAGMMATIAGSGTVTATLTGTKLAISGSFEGLRSPATVARLHRAQKGVRGPAVFDLVVTNTPSAGVPTSAIASTAGTISATLDLTPTQVDDLGRERFYVQLHSEKAPEGNLWGWLQLQETKR